MSNCCGNRLLMKYILFVCVVLMTLSGCRDKIICPAFQSTYILDDSVRTVYYSYLWKLDKEERIRYLEKKRATDTTATTVAPAKTADYYSYLEKYIVPEREVEKTKYGIVKYEPYWMKNYQQRTSPKENILTPPAPAVEPTLTPYQDTGEIIAADFRDSTQLKVDSTAVAVIQPDSVEEVFVLPTLARSAPKKEKPPVKYRYRYNPKDSLLNVEQEYYNKYFGQLLVDNRKPIQSKVEPVTVPVKDKPILSDTTGAAGPGIRINFGKKGKKEEELPLEEGTGEAVDETEESDGF